MARVGDAKMGFLGRLRKNQAGNTLAMTAAAVFPMIALVGGGVDMARMYAVRSRLQAACDAGALAGRRVMGTGQWSDNSNAANTNALRTFDLNFAVGSFGSTNRTRSFSESGGTVTGTASADVPMTLMRLFHMPTKTLTVTCDGQMRIPNTDVMFVLDNSGSMAWTIPGDASGISKMNGLKVAIKCFYEALAKQDISDVTPTQCGTGSNPSGGLSSQVQLRFGFVNYDNMVNVGKLLPNDYLVDNATYQSRAPNTETIRAWTIGASTTPTWGSWSPASTPSSYQNNTAYGTFNTVPGPSNGDTLINGTLYDNSKTAANNTACKAFNTYSGGKLVAVAESSSVVSSTTPTDNNPPVYPATTQNQSTTETDTRTVTGYKYVWVSSTCVLQSAAANSTYNRTRTGTASAPITWTDYTNIRDWTYKAVSHNVAPLKAGGSTWNGSVDLPLTQTNGPTVYASGSSAPMTIKQVANTSVSWDGCIEERQTYQNTDGNGADDWTGYPASPAAAKDMDIDMVPSTGDDTTRWRPLLVNAVWGRETSMDGWGNWNGSATLNNYTTTILSTDRNLSSFTGCVTTSRKLAIYTGTTGANNLRDYVNTLYPNGNTYHDIGLLWGARLMSPTGIFASENALTAGGAQIQRNLIFMTDGDTANTWNNYASYGVEWWDRRQMDPSGLATWQYESRLMDNNNARSAALCTAIKNKNIKLWVISYGDAVNASTVARLQACASGPNYYFAATNTATLVTQFRQIADKISNLRLTS